MSVAVLRRQCFNNLRWVSRALLNGKNPISLCSTIAEDSTPVKLAYNIFEGAASGAPPLVIMHGLFGSKQNWRSIGKAIEAQSNPKRKVITIDARNHGESPHSKDHSYEHLAADISQLFQDLNIKKAVLLGHSMGGRAMMYFALKWPDLVDRAVFVDISPLNNSSSFAEMRIIFNAMHSIEVASNLSLSEGRQKVQQHLLKSVQNQETVNFLLMNLRKSDQKGFYWIVNVNDLGKNFSNILLFPTDQLESLKYNGPVLFIGGKKSNFINEASFPQVKEFFPNAQLSWLDTGHLVQLEKPAEFLSLVIKFIKT